MARSYRKSSGGKKRGPKKGYHQSAAHRKAISEGLKRYYKSGGKSHGGRRKGGSHKKKRRARGTAHPYGRIAESMMSGRRKRGGRGRPKGSKNKYLTHSRTGKSYFKK